VSSWPEDERRLPSARADLAFVLVTLAVVVVSAVAVQGAVRYYGHPIAGIFIDSSGVVSAVGPAYLDGKQKNLAFPDRILAINGVPLEGPGTPASIWDEEVDEAIRRGDSQVSVRVDGRDGSQRDVDLRLESFQPMAWWQFAAATLFVGWLWAGAGLLALRVGRKSALARTTAKVGVLNGLFMLTLFDLHASRNLVPVFFVAYAMLPPSWLMLGLRLPDDAPLLVRAPWLERAADFVSLAFAATLVGTYLVGESTHHLQQVATWWLGSSLLGFTLTFIVRFLRARGDRRDTMRALVVAMVPPHVVVGLLLVLTARGAGSGIGDFLIYPMLGLAPVATLYAFVRHDLWQTRALLSRLLTRILLAVALAGVAISVGAAAGAMLDVSFRAALVGATVGAGLAALLVPFALAGADRFLFPARASYKPTVAQLSSELTSTTSRDDVARAIDRTVRRWLDCESVTLVLGEGVGDEPLEESRSVERNKLQGAELRLPLTFGGMHLGQLEVGRKRGGALFTRDDVDLLRTIVDQGALALAHAQAYEELERRRREEAAAWRGERAAVLWTVASEASHEVRYTINFLRSVFELGDGALDAEAMEIGREEVGRLERLLKGLRGLAPDKLDTTTVSLRSLCERVEVLLRDELADRSIAMEVAADVVLRCDEDKMIQILVNLVANALHATANGGNVGVRFQRVASGGQLTIWDTGPGFADKERLFARWYTTKPQGSGLGLVITQRLVRKHDWMISADRVADRTVFVIEIPAKDLRADSSPGADQDHDADVA
jgi:two-component system, NtrC family, sensor histidine kinase HydH